MISKSRNKRVRVSKAKRKNFASDYGYARVRDKAFDAVHELWTRRKSEGIALVEVADKIGRDKGWLSKQMSSPGNWTLRTFGELVAALDGEAEIAVHGLEDPTHQRSNYNAYSTTEPKAENRAWTSKVHFNSYLPQVAKSITGQAQTAKTKMEFTK
jgi:hypothetical protein